MGSGGFYMLPNILLSNILSIFVIIYPEMKNIRQ